MNLSHELATAKRLALEAGRVLLEFYDLPADIELAAGAEVVTAADKAANPAHRRRPRRPRSPTTASSPKPDTVNRLDRDWLWVVDPMDGTKEFIKKNGEFSVKIGLAVDGRPVVGVVYQPTLDGMFSAMAGAGAFLEIEGGDAGSR